MRECEWCGGGNCQEPAKCSIEYKDGRSRWFCPKHYDQKIAKLRELERLGRPFQGVDKGAWK